MTKSSIKMLGIAPLRSNQQQAFCRALDHSALQRLHLRRVWAARLQSQYTEEAAQKVTDFPQKAGPQKLFSRREEGATRAKLAVFVSGGGSNFKKIHEAILDHTICADITVVVSDVPHCGACKYAAAHGIPIVRYPASREEVEQSREHNADSPEALRELLVGMHKVDFAVLAGYLKLVPKEVVAAFPRAMLNIHPGFLPTFGGKGFYGERVHKAVIASGVRFTGPTVHFVDENYDTGPIVAQRVIPVSPIHDHKHLAAQVLKEEHILYPEVVAALVDGRISWREDGIPIMWNPQ